jgi:hypothetical protein
MTPKEKAIEIVDSYFTIIDGQVEFKLIKQCALIAVDEIIDANPLKFDEDENPLTEFWWKLVKDEIEKL